MRFNRGRFLEETCGDLDALFDCIDVLTETLDKYIKDDNDAGGEGFGCYNNPESSIREGMINSSIAEYLDY